MTSDQARMCPPRLPRPDWASVILNYTATVLFHATHRSFFCLLIQPESVVHNVPFAIFILLPLELLTLESLVVRLSVISYFDVNLLSRLHVTPAMARRGVS